MPTMTPAYILLIDDHAMFRSGLRMVLNAGIPDSVILEANSIETVGDEKRVDVVVLDIKLPGTSGMEGIARIKQKWPQTPVLMLSSLDTPETVKLAFAHGATGFISKAETAERIIEAITQALCDISVCEAGCTRPKRLTIRQHEVLDLLGQGLSNKLIARQFSLSENTVRRHVQDILEFFQVASRAEAVCAARRQGLLH
jgi:DNA-binding NarL/FixJ family response regulator